jgi:FHS family L-fucose permease-like MFS transporter
MAGGCSILETTANPYILSMGSAENMTQRLNLAQSFNPIGSISGIMLSQMFILSQLSANKEKMNEHALQAAQQNELNAITLTYMGVGVVLIILLILILSYRKMPSSKDSSDLSFTKISKQLFKKSRYSLGVLSQFFYVGAQIGVWSYSIRYVMKALKFVDPATDNILTENVLSFINNHTVWSNIWQFDATTTAENIGNSYYLTSILLFTLSRFVFTALMKYFRPGLLLTIAATGAIFSASIAIFATGMTGIVGLVSISVFMSLMFPTIYGIALEGLTPSEAKVGGSFLVMAILGGALLTAFQGLISTIFDSVHYSYFIPVLCFVIVALYGSFTNRTQREKT